VWKLKRMGSKRTDRRPDRPRQHGARRAGGSGTPPGLAAVVALVVLLGVMFVIRLTTAGSKAHPATVGRPLAAAVVRDLKRASGVGVGTISAAVGPKLVHGATLWRVGGRPVVFYAGGNYCPFCAAERWVIVLALERFGTFSGLRTMRSSMTDYYPGTPTVTFHGAHYQSPYIVFRPVELFGGSPTTPLETPTKEESQIFDRYDAPPYTDSNHPGQIPFLDVANRYLFIGAAYDPALLANKSWSQVASTLASPSPTPLGTAVWSNVNALTAAICAVDGNQPASACSLPGVRLLEAGLPK
jgi:hypothetical protein